MSKLHHPVVHLVCALAITGSLAVACVGSDDVDNEPGAGGTGGTSGGDTGGTSGGGTGGSTAGTGGTGGGTAGTGGGGPVTPRCATKSAVPGATLLDFEMLVAGNGATTIPDSAIQIGTYVYLDPMDLTATQIDDQVVICPLHMHVFELDTGCSRSGQPGLTSYPVAEDADGYVVVQLPA